MLLLIQALWNEIISEPKQAIIGGDVFAKLMKGLEELKVSDALVGRRLIGVAQSKS